MATATTTTKPRGAGQFLTRHQLAAALGVSVDAVMRAVRHPTSPLPHLRFGRRYLFSLDESIGWARSAARRRLRGRKGGEAV